MDPVYYLLCFIIGPVQPVNLTATVGITDMNITWSLPEGRADHYVVNIAHQNLTLIEQQNVTVIKAHFASLYPGRSYVVTVTAVAGNISNKSDNSTFATGKCKFY